MEPGSVADGTWFRCGWNLVPLRMEPFLLSDLFLFIA